MPDVQLSDRQPVKQDFDVLVIGGGITGAWTALDCSLRGLSTILVEIGDFGGATSMRSSRLLHGGIRYLQQLELRKVRESSRERELVAQSAPHMVDFVPFMVPTFSGIQRGRAFLHAGMLAYRALTMGTHSASKDPALKIPSDHRISRSEIQRHGILSKEKITGGRILYEAQVQSSERMTFEVINRARAEGAVALNYMAVQRYIKTGDQVEGVVAKDLVSGNTLDLKARIVINAAGPWCDSLNDNASLQKLNTGFARGAHIITRSLLGPYAVALPSSFKSDGVATRGNRHIFIIPWRNRSLIGTSYMESSEPTEDLTPTPDEIQQLIDTVNQSLPESRLTTNDVIRSFAGYYPLQSATIKKGIYQGTGEYRLVDHRTTDRVEGLITALGAKFTTARRIAELATELAQKKLGHTTQNGRPTRSIKLLGSEYKELDQFRSACLKKYANLWSNPVCLHLINCYGSRIDEIATLCDQDPALNRVLFDGGDTIAAQIVWAARHEVVVHLGDILFRRTDLGLLNNLTIDVIKHCADLAGEGLGWDDHRRQIEIKLVQNELEKTMPASNCG